MAACPCCKASPKPAITAAAAAAESGCRLLTAQHRVQYQHKQGPTSQGPCQVWCKALQQAYKPELACSRALLRLEATPAAWAASTAAHSCGTRPTSPVLCHCQDPGWPLLLHLELLRQAAAHLPLLLLQQQQQELRLKQQQIRALRKRCQPCRTSLRRLLRTSKQLWRRCAAAWHAAAVLQVKLMVRVLGSKPSSSHSRHWAVMAAAAAATVLSTAAQAKPHCLAAANP